MIRVRATGNATFDAVEAAAYQAFQSSKSTKGTEDTGPIFGVQSEGSFEIAYLYTCFSSAVQYSFEASDQRIAATGNATAWLGTPKLPSTRNATRNIATRLRALGVALPTGFYIANFATAAVVSGGSTNFAIVGDVLSITGGSTTAGAWQTAATVKVATIDSGPIPVTVATQMTAAGWYYTPPTGNMTTTATNVNGTYTDCTITVTFKFMPIEYSF